MESKKNETTANQEDQENLPIAGEEGPHENLEDYEEEKEKITSDAAISDLQAQYDELKDKYLRLYSEFENFRKRTIKEKGELIKTAGENIIGELLPVIDDFDRAIKLNEQVTDIEAIKHGVQLIHSKINNILSHKGLEPMKTIGLEFDPDVHEAITNIPATSEDMKGKVVDELEKGYFLNGKVIRYAKVVVGS